MSELPLVCICVPTYNAAGTVRETLSSILLQTYQNIVVHVSDNASTDDTIRVVESISDPRIVIHKHAKNLGGEENFNHCIRLAQGKYTAIFHADDIYEPQMVRKQVEFLESHPDAGAVFTAASTIDENGRKFGEINFPSSLAPFNQLYNFEMIFKAVLKHSNFLICPSVMARTSIYQKEIQSWRGGLFNSSADLDVWLRIAKKHLIGLLPEPLMRYRISENQFSAQVRLQTARPDFFLVTEHYLDDEDVRLALDRTDLDNYVRLDRRDRVMRAVNSFIALKYSDARNLLHDIFSWDALVAGVQTKRGLGVLLAGTYMRGLLFLKLEGFGRVTLGYLKRVLHK